MTEIDWKLGEIPEDCVVNPSDAMPGNAERLVMHYLRNQGRCNIPFSQPTTGKFLQTLFTLNPDVPITVMRVGQMLELRMIEDAPSAEG